MWRLIRLVAPRTLWNRLRSVASLQQAVLIDHSKKALVAVASVPGSQQVPMDVARAIHAVFCRFDFPRQHCASCAMIAGDTCIVVDNLVGVQSRRIRRTGDSVSATRFPNDSVGSPVSRRPPCVFPIPILPNCPPCVCPIPIFHFKRTFT